MPYTLYENESFLSVTYVLNSWLLKLKDIKRLFLWCSPRTAGETLIKKNSWCRYMAEILLIWHKTPNNQSIIIHIVKCLLNNSIIFEGKKSGTHTYLILYKMLIQTWGMHDANHRRKPTVDFVYYLSSRRNQPWVSSSRRNQPWVSDDGCKPLQERRE